MALAAWPWPGLLQMGLPYPLQLWAKPVCTSVNRSGGPKKPCHDDDLCLPVDHQQVPWMRVPCVCMLSNGSGCLAMASAISDGAALAAAAMA